mgnify:CR=1 FL=1
MKKSSIIPWLLCIILALIVAGFIAYNWTDSGKALIDRFLDQGSPQTVQAPVSLIPPFSSHASVDSVRQVIEKQGKTFRVSENFVPKIQNIPAKNLHTVTVEGYLHHDIPGELILEFLNDALYEAAFYPYDANAYAPVLRNRMGLRPDPRQNGRSEVLNGNLRISSNVFLAVTKVGKSLNTRAYVIWQDRALLKERRR